MTDEPKPNAAPRQIDPLVAADLARLALDLSHDPATRKEFGKLVKKAKPNSPHANAFADVEMDDKFESWKAQQEQERIKAQQDAVLTRMNAQRTALLTGGADGSGKKYSEDDVKKIEELMQKRGITDYEDGAILYAATLPPPTPKPPSDIPAHGSTWEFPEWATFGKDPVRASRNIANQVIGEFQRKHA
jgi:hypothetical protein